MRDDKSSAAADLRTRRSTLVGVVFLLGAVNRKRAQLLQRVRQRRSGQRSLQQPLRDEVGKAPVRRRRVRVILEREPKVTVPRADLVARGRTRPFRAT